LVAQPVLRACLGCASTATLEPAPRTAVCVVLLICGGARAGLATSPVEVPVGVPAGKRPVG